MVIKKDEDPVDKNKAEPTAKRIHRAPPPVYDNPAKVKVRKEDVYCHLSFFIFSLVIYLASVAFMPKKDISLQKPSIFSDLDNKVNPKPFGEIIDPHLKDEEEEIIRRVDNIENYVVCSLYIAKSGIPNSGFGIFSTKDVAVGEVVIGESSPFSISNVEVSPHLLYMKHHAEYNNVSGGIGGGTIVATKDIEAGEELFFNLDDYPKELRLIYQRLHPSDPSQVSFEKADLITQKIIEAIPMRQVQIKPEKKQYKKKSNKPKFVPKPALDGTPLFELMKDLLKEYDPTLSDLIPDNDSIARSIVKYGGRSMYIPKGRSLDSLIEHGICVNGIQPSKSLIYQRNNGGITNRSVKKGEIITTSPMVATTGMTDPRCLKEKGNADGYVLCFLSFSSQVNEGISAGDCDAKKAGDCPYNKANAYYQWSKCNQFSKDVENLSISELIMTHPDRLTMDIIASRDIQQGEEVIIDFDLDSGGYERIDS